MRGKPVVDAMPVAHQQVEIREVFSVDPNKKSWIREEAGS